MRPFRRLSNGYLFSPDPLPVAPPGYEKVSPTLFKPIAVPCEHRKTELKKGGCCKKEQLVCNIVNQPIHLGICADCKANPNWVKMHFAL